MQKDIVDLRELSNAEIMNSVREESSLDYQTRIPVADQANIMQAIEGLAGYAPHMNEFLNGFVNRIGQVIARTQSWTNPLGIFKKGLMGYGDTIEEWQADLLEAHKYGADRDYGEKTLFGQERPAVKVNYHTVNREDFYKLTINYKQLKRAFLNEGGLSTLITALMASPVQSDQLDEFLLMSNLFALNESNGGFFKVQVPDFNGLSTDQTDARTALKIIRSLSMKLGFLSRDYNAAAMPIAAKPEDLVLIGTPDFLSSIDVDGLAPIFHIDRADTQFERVVPLPQEFFKITGAQGAITTKDFFQVYDNLLENRTQPNPAGLYDNFFMHHWQTISLSRFVPAILLTSDSGSITIAPKAFTVTAVAAPTLTDSDGVAAAAVVRGNIYRLDTAVTTSPAGEDVAVAYSITGNNSPMTYITKDSVLYVAKSETSTSLVVTGISTVIDPTDPRLDGISNSVTLAVSGTIVTDWPGAGKIAGITINGVQVASVAVGTLTYALTLPAGTKVTPKTVKVDTIGGPDVTTTVVAGAPGYTVTVKVDSGIGAGNTKTYVVTVTVP